MIFQQFGGINGVGFYASSVFVSAGFSSGKLGTIAIALLSFPMTGLGALLMDKSGRRPLLLVSAVGTCLGLVFVTISFLLQFSSHASLKTSLALAGILVYMGSVSLGMGAIPWIIMSEIFPINMKGVAGSPITLINWFGAWFTSYTFNFLMIGAHQAPSLYSWASAASLLYLEGDQMLCFCIRSL